LDFDFDFDFDFEWLCFLSTDRQYQAREAVGDRYSDFALSPFMAVS
jgi:hypothetical protein